MDIKNLTENEVSIIAELLEKEIDKTIWVFDKKEFEVILAKVKQASWFYNRKIEYRAKQF